MLPTITTFTIWWTLFVVVAFCVFRIPLFFICVNTGCEQRFLCIVQRVVRQNTFTYTFTRCRRRAHALTGFERRIDFGNTLFFQCNTCVFHVVVRNRPCTRLWICSPIVSSYPPYIMYTCLPPHTHTPHIFTYTKWYTLCVITFVVFRVPCVFIRVNTCCK